MIPNKVHLIKISVIATVLMFSGWVLAKPTLPEAKVIGVEKASVRQGPNFLSKKVGEVKYGEKVRSFESQKNWSRISFGKINGWLHSSAFGNSKSILNDIGKGAAASNKVYKDEVVAAGKGFNEEYEKVYKSKNPKANFAAVDQLEKRVVENKHLVDFANSGKLQSKVLKGE